jgi:hypothetical protein
VDLLKQLLALERVTADELRVTKVGVLVAKLAKRTDLTEVAPLAKQLLTKWKAQVLPPTPATANGVDAAKAAAAAAAQAKAAGKAADAPATVAAVAASAAKKKAAASSDAESESDGESSRQKRKEKKRKQKEEAESAAKKDKKRKGDGVSNSPSASPSPTPAVSKAKSAAAAADGSLAAQHPELAKGPFALFQTDDSARDKMQFLLYQALGEPPAEVLQAQQARGDLSEYKSKAKVAEAPSDATAASPSPPPIAAVTIASPAVPADVPASAAAPVASAASAAASAPTPAPAAAPSASPSPPPPTLRTRVELAFLIEAAMFSKGNGNLYYANSGAYKEKYRDLAPQLKDPNNPDINLSLYLGKITPEELVVMPLAQMAPAAMKEKRAKEAAWAREAARSDIGQAAAATDMFLCDMSEQRTSNGRCVAHDVLSISPVLTPIPLFLDCSCCCCYRCKGRRCIYFQQQTRGADEPMTIVSAYPAHVHAPVSSCITERVSPWHVCFFFCVYFSSSLVWIAATNSARATANDEEAHRLLHRIHSSLLRCFCFGCCALRHILFAFGTRKRLGIG